MKDTNLDELIDAYLKNRMTDEQKIHLDHQMESDPAIRKLVKESEIAYGYLRYKKYDAIRKQLQNYDRIKSQPTPGQKHTRSFIRELVVLLFTIVIGAFYLSLHFSAERVARRNIITLASGTTASASGNIEFSNAVNLFLDKKYSSAEIMFEQFLEDAVNDHTQIAAWNALMCELAQNGFNESIQKKLSMFSDVETLHLDQRSARIRSLSRSRIIRWFIFPAGNNVPPIRPRLM